MAKQKTQQEIARLKEFVSGKLYFEYQKVMADIFNNAGDSEQDLRRANLDAQSWLLMQCYEVVCGDKVRPLGLNDISKLNGFALNTWLVNVSKKDFTIECLDNLPIEKSHHFKIVEKGLTVKLREPTLEEAYDIQQASSGDGTGNALTEWVLKNLFTINDSAITEEDLLEVYNYKLISFLVGKINDFFSEQSLQNEMSFCLRNTPDGD